VVGGIGSLLVMVVVLVLSPESRRGEVLGERRVDTSIMLAGVVTTPRRLKLSRGDVDSRGGWFWVLVGLE